MVFTGRHVSPRFIRVRSFLSRRGSNRWVCTNIGQFGRFWARLGLSCEAGCILLYFQYKHGLILVLSPTFERKCCRALLYCLCFMQKSRQGFINSHSLKWCRVLIYVRPRSVRVSASLLLVTGNVQHPAVHDREDSSQGLRAMICIHTQQQTVVLYVRLP